MQHMDLVFRWWTKSILQLRPNWLSKRNQWRSCVLVGGRFTFKGALNFSRKSHTPVSWLLNNLSFLVIFPQMTCEPPEKKTKTKKHLNLSPKSILPFDRFLPELFSSHFTAVYVLVRAGWQLAWAADWHWRVWIDSLHPRSASRRDKCGERWSGEGSRPVIDMGATARGQSHASKKRGYRFCCPLNKHRDISARCRYRLWLLPASPK